MSVSFVLGLGQLVPSAGVLLLLVRVHALAAVTRLVLFRLSTMAMTVAMTVAIAMVVHVMDHAFRR